VDVGEARVLHVAGQTPRGEAPADLRGQSQVCFRQISDVLEACGASIADVVQITVYLTDLADYAEFAAVRAEVFGDEPPASAAVGVASLLDGALVEISAVAVTGR
jgi:2-iminobutanoate/2-iminopropanoate deaminase